MPKVTLPFEPPLPWDDLLAYLGPRTVRGVERIEGGVYRRAVRIGETAGHLEVRPHASKDALVATLSPSLAPHASAVTARLRLLFDLDVDTAAVAKHLRADPLLRPLVKKYPGLRVPGAFDPFEMAVRAILGQLVSVKGATTLCGRVVERFGRPSSFEAEGLPSLFPTAADLAAIDVPTMRTIGLPEARARSIIELARAVASGRVDLTGSDPPETTIAALVALPGIGPWTANYFAMRALHWSDAFLAADLGIMKALSTKNVREIQARADAWRPWRAYAVLLLWSSLS